MAKINLLPWRAQVRKQRERIARTYIIQDLGQDAPRGQRKQNSDGNGERGL